MMTQTKNIKLIQLHWLYEVEIRFSVLRPKYILMRSAPLFRGSDFHQLTHGTFSSMSSCLDN